MGNKLCVCKLAIALGLSSALFTFLLGLSGKLWGYGAPLIALYRSIYPGFAPTIVGSLLGALWSWIGTFLFVMVAGFFYCLLKKGCSACGCRKKFCGKGDNPVEQ